MLEEAGGDDVAAVLASLASFCTSAHAPKFDMAEQVLERARDANRHWFQRGGRSNVAGAWRTLLAGRIDVAAGRAATTLDLAEQTGDTDLIASAIEIAALAALAGGDADVSVELLVRMVAYCREHELANLADGLAGLSHRLRAPRRLRGRPAVPGRAPKWPDPGTAETVPYRRLAEGFVDLAEGRHGASRRDRHRRSRA